MFHRGLGSWTVLLSVGLAVLVGCEGGAPAAESGGVTSGQPEATDVVSVSSTGQMTVDMDAIFPAGEGRDLVLNNCQSCHTWVPIVVLQMNEDEWNRWGMDHRQRVPGISDEEFETLKSYLIANFNPNSEVPELPPVLLESWTTY